MDGLMDGRMDGRTDGRTDGQTDKAGCRVACTRLKIFIRGQHNSMILVIPYFSLVL